MPKKAQPKTPAERMKTYRERMRAKGLKQKTIWVIDMNAPGFKEELSRQIRSLNKDHENEMMDFLEQVQDLGQP